jgi:long-chain acyl-CoA synthetase
MRELVTSYLEDFLTRGEAIAFAYREGLRTYRWTYADIARNAYEFADLLAERGINKGARVLLCGANSANWVIAFFGCLLRGAIVVPLDLQSEPGFIQRVQRQVDAKLAILDGEARRSFHPGLPIIPLEELTRATSTQSSYAFPKPVDSVDSMGSVNDIAEIVFTSGTTAEPKGTVITHKNLLANLQPLEKQIRPYLKWERLVHPIRFLNLLPLSHVFGQFMGVFVPQLLDGEVFFADSLKPSEVVETVKRERISVIVCVPRMLDTLRQRVEREFDGTALEEALDRARNWSIPRRWWKFRRVHRMFGLKFWAFISGGATLNAETEEFWRRLGFAVIQGYGMTETASLVSVNHPFKKKAGSIGAIMPGQEVRLSEQGEILVRGPNVSPGYWTNLKDAETGRRGEGESAPSPRLPVSASPRPPVFPSSLDAQGWLHTGDVGELDEEGNLYFKGRSKEVIVTSAGMNVYPEDLEAALNNQPEIKSSAVIGIEGPRGPEPVAALILRNSVTEPGDAEVMQIIERANQDLTEHQKIRRWFVWPEEDFPRTATQKIRKPLIAEAIKKASSRHRVESTAADPLATLIARVSGEPVGVLSRDAKLATDLKLDSLARVELLGAIEDRYQVEINEAAFSDATTVGDIQTLIREGSTDHETEYRSNRQEAEGSIGNRQSAIGNAYPYPHWPHRWPINWLRIAALYLIIFPYVRIMGRPAVKGYDHLKDQQGPLLFVSNHLSKVDHALILWASPHHIRRKMSIAMDGELLREWISPPAGTGWFTRLRYRVQYILVAFFFNIFAMPQHSGFRRSFAFAGEMMDRGYSVLVFPEGRRSPDGKLHKFRSGIGLLAQQLNVPVVPIRLDAIYELAQQGKHIAPPGALKINIGGVVEYSAEDSEQQITEDLESRIKKL